MSARCGSCRLRATPRWAPGPGSPPPPAAPARPTDHRPIPHVMLCQRPAAASSSRSSAPLSPPGPPRARRLPAADRPRALCTGRYGAARGVPRATRPGRSATSRSGSGHRARPTAAPAAGRVAQRPSPRGWGSRPTGPEPRPAPRARAQGGRRAPTRAASLREKRAARHPRARISPGPRSGAWPARRPPQTRAPSGSARTARAAAGPAARGPTRGRAAPPPPARRSAGRRRDRRG